MVRMIVQPAVEKKYVSLHGSALLLAQARLIRSGIPCRLNSGSVEEKRYAARYAVHVDRLAAAKIRQHQMGGSEAVFMPDPESGRYEDGLHRRLEKAALRSLYTLGVDEGEVIITARPGRRYVVEDVRMPADRSKAVMSAKGQGSRRTEGYPANNEEGDSSLVSSLLMGMDPEFVLMKDNGDIVFASEFMERGGSVGSDAVRLRGEVIYPIAELRPSPKANPKELLLEMQKALREAHLLIQDRSLAWKAGALPYGDFPLGGHIHFSGVPLSLSLLQTLDNYVALPLTLLEDPNGRLRRPRYGFLGDFRRQPYGGFEYRTLPSFLVSPLVAKVSLGVAYLAARYSDRLPGRPLNTERYHRAYYEGDKSVLKECIAGWHRDLSALPEYPDYAREIERAVAHMETGRTWDESRDIRPLWNIPTKP
ncbi:putative amidoligase domain-containing protein [Paenibacillus sp. Y412MC10]|uniref:putative amidoligase domain-containing protein n=1 Tax=Geobacillus sp. (strain Y412MC10) TaxID=481743 RepID=UPI0001B9EC8E|nr:hypothetical protein [Paenibacillus sp. Y412MC10]ACX64626.1 hypothetical protein GYMC10_2348 [Paenibacillus sp. Y412MC10]